ncbi:MAG: hypothetical protein AABY97_04370 [Chloroflexota bacterium]
MRGIRTSISRKKADLVLVSVRYQADGRLLQYVRGYARQGAVWSDLRLIDREQLLEMMGSGARVLTGRVTNLEGDFELTRRVTLRSIDSGQELLAVDGVSNPRDELELPLF